MDDHIFTTRHAFIMSTKFQLVDGEDEWILVDLMEEKQAPVVVGLEERTAASENEWVLVVLGDKTEPIAVVGEDERPAATVLHPKTVLSRP